MKLLADWKKPQGLVIIAMILFAAYFCMINVLRQVHLQTSQFDMGNMDQVLWNTIHGNFFQMTSPINAVHELRSAVHADFLLLAYVPFYALWPDPRMMMIVQTIAVATGALPLFWFARKRLNEKFAAWAAISYLLYPALLWSVVFDIHAVVFATPLLLWAFWAMSEKRWKTYAILVVLALLSKEEIGMTIGLLGLYAAWKYRPRWIGLTTFIVGFGWTALMLGYIIPHSRHAPGHFALEYYSQYGSTMGQVVRHLATHPWEILVKFFNLNGIGYQATILVPLAFLSVLGLPILVLATPELAINLLSNNNTLQAIYYQYTAVLTPFIFLSAVVGASWLYRHMPRTYTIRVAALSAIIIAQAASIFFYAPLPGMRYRADAIHPYRANPYEANIKKIKKLVQTNDKLATTNNVAAQFTQRSYEWSFPNHYEQADGLVILATSPFDVYTAQQLKQQAENLKSNTSWELMLQDKDLYYFRRVR